MGSRALTHPSIAYAPQNDRHENIHLDQRAATLRGRGSPRTVSWDIANQRFFYIPDAYRADPQKAPYFLQVIQINDFNPNVQQAPGNNVAFCDSLTTALVRYGFRTGGDPLIRAFNFHPLKHRSARTERGNVLRELARVFAQLEQLQKPGLIVVLLPSRNASLYATVKRWADCIQGIPTVCMGPAAVRRTADAGLLANIW